MWGIPTNIPKFEERVGWIGKYFVQIVKIFFKTPIAQLLHRKWMVNNQSKTPDSLIVCYAHKNGCKDKIHILFFSILIHLKYIKSACFLHVYIVLKTSMPSPK